MPMRRLLLPPLDSTAVSPTLAPKPTQEAATAWLALLRRWRRELRKTDRSMRKWTQRLAGFRFTRHQRLLSSRTPRRTRRPTIGQALGTFIKTGQAVSVISRLPEHQWVDADLTTSGAAAIHTAFASPDSFYFAAGELGAASAIGDSALAYTQMAHFDFTVDLLGTASQGDVLLGFYDPVVSGALSEIGFVVNVNGSKTVDQKLPVSSKRLRS